MLIHGTSGDHKLGRVFENYGKTNFVVKLKVNIPSSQKFHSQIPALEKLVMHVNREPSKNICCSVSVIMKN